MKRFHLALALCLVLIALVAVGSGREVIKTEREGNTGVDREVDEDGQNDVDLIKQITRKSVRRKRCRWRWVRIRWVWKLLCV
ncbi:hypothetical protein LSAT2_003809 [Lamellibrachia satsuma]|nr:hypothetical protein LSAT2_003809 [Lamellibrachia satsuma]